MQRLPIKTRVTEKGQRYVDEPVYLKPRADLCTPIAIAVKQAVHSPLPRRILSGYVRTFLNWAR